MSGPRTAVQQLMCSLPKFLKSPGLYELDIQSRTHRKRCHYWQLLDGLFGFCGRIGGLLHAWIFATGSSARIWSVFRCVRPRRNEHQLLKDWGIVSLKTPKAVFSASERKYTGAGGDIQVPHLGVVFTSGESRNKGIDTRTGKCKCSSAWALLLRGDETGTFKLRKAFNFKIGLCSDPHLWSWILGDDWKNTVKRTNSRDGILAAEFSV